MGPKRKAAPRAKAAGKGKKVKVEVKEEEEVVQAPDRFQSAMQALRATTEKKGKAKVDAACQLSHSDGCEVYEDYDCTLNQTNIGSNNNKFYIIQLIRLGQEYWCWNRWGRVVDVVDGVGKKVKQKVRLCSLDKPTQDLMSLIFSNDMFKEAMQTMNLDIKKMPLGKLSKVQIARGFDALEQLQGALERSADNKELSDLTSRFYTIIPHNFGRRTPPVINSQEVLQAKKDMLLVLADIELAQTLQADKLKQEDIADLPDVPHPLDLDYQLLKCHLNLLDCKSEEHKVIETYVEHTGPTYQSLKILSVWRVDRENEEERLQAHQDIENRRLLWHGTNVAVVAAILKSGLRIMPHSGGRVGRGIYFASENSKSAGYVGRTSKNLGIMFLNEVALGREHHITNDDSSLRAPPSEYDSVVARGVTEPDPALDKVLVLDGRKVTVPQGCPIQMPKYKNSNFSQSEYLVYKENQCRLRYLLLLQF
ncbi:hypothetical protein FKM82_029095 [Ascaphus truei]